MTCPQCASAMEAMTLDGHLGVPVAIDMCRSCQVFWFDPHEDLRLAPASTLKVFQIIGAQASSPPPPSAAAPACPRCGLRLLQTHDQQHATKFEYLRCARGHGRLITFVNFLLEKDFIRPLSPDQIDELRERKIQVISCSKCGAPVDLTRGPTCSHCGASLSMLDVSRMAGLESL
jgi:DNA-directed RNA polymerase subunit RPC12/RpoP